jgi:hypothetical protein
MARGCQQDEQPYRKSMTAFEFDKRTIEQHFKRKLYAKRRKELFSK